jgi:hypothetical protein
MFVIDETGIPDDTLVEKMAAMQKIMPSPTKERKNMICMLSDDVTD